MLRIRLIGPPGSEGWSNQRVMFDPCLPAKESDGLLCWGQGERELIEYQGPRAWYYPEPRGFSLRRARHFRSFLRHLRREEFLHYSNPDKAYAIPVVTHYGTLDTLANKDRSDEIVAIVSNYGGRLWWLSKGARLRNAFVCHPDVRLHGGRSGWSSFRRRPWSRPGPPDNYRGPWDDSTSDWYLPDHIELLARFRYVVCLENSIEPDYFTEKFVNACRAGCVPIYHAHPTIRDGVLRGATWIDPADHDFDVDRTLAAARRSDVDRIVATNSDWLRSGAVDDREGFRIWARIADLFYARLGREAAASS